MPQKSVPVSPERIKLQALFLFRNAAKAVRAAGEASAAVNAVLSRSIAAAISARSPRIRRRAVRSASTGLAASRRAASNAVAERSSCWMTALTTPIARRNRNRRNAGNLAGRASTLNADMPLRRGVGDGRKRACVAAVCHWLMKLSSDSCRLAKLKLQFGWAPCHAMAKIAANYRCGDRPFRHPNSRLLRQSQPRRGRHMENPGYLVPRTSGAPRCEIQCAGLGEEGPGNEDAKSRTNQFA